MNMLSEGRSRQEMKVVCAWCGKDMGEKDNGGIERVSHGMREECFDKMKVETEKVAGVDGEPDDNKSK